MFLVDGYNVIRRTSSLARAEKGSLAAGRRALVAAIVASGVLRSRRVTLVFDGSAGAPPLETSPHPRLSIRFSAPPASADDAILSLLEDARDKGKAEAVTVVTADRALSWRVSGLGARVVSPESWPGLARNRPRKAGPAPVEGAEKPRATASDVDYWLEVFGSSEDD